MKKFVALLFVSMFFLAGCGSSNKVTCTKKVTEGEDSYKLSIVGNLKGGKVKSVDMEMSFDDKEKADSYCKILELSNSSAEEEDKLDFKCSGKTIILPYSEIEDENDFIGLTKDEFIEMAKADDSITCK